MEWGIRRRSARATQEFWLYFQRLGIQPACGGSHPHHGLPYTAPLHPQPPAPVSNRALDSRKLGALTWLLRDPGTTVVAQTSRHRGQHVAGVNHAIACRKPPANTRNPTPLSDTSNTTKSHIRSWHVVPLILEINCMYADVSVVLLTCPGSHPRDSPHFKTR